MYRKLLIIAATNKSILCRKMLFIYIHIPKNMLVKTVKNLSTKTKRKLSITMAVIKLTYRFQASA